MNFLTKLKKSEKFHFYGTCFLVPFMVMMFMFLFDGIFPFGNLTFLREDMYHQYLPFMTEFYHKIKNHEGLYYSWNAGLGANFTALYVYYLASPVNWLVLLFPEKYILEFMSYLVVIKIGLSGCTSAYYLRNHFNTNSRSVIVFSAVYALNGFVAAYSWNVMWMDCIVLAPLIILGLERLVKEGKCRLYCICLALSILSNYYISIMICIFLVLYFIILLITDSKGIRSIAAAFGRFVIYSVLAGGMAACLLVPEVMAMMHTSFSKVSFPRKIEFYMNVFQILSRQLVGVKGETGLGHQQNSYCGIMVLILVPVYVMSSKVRLRERICKAALIIFFIFSFNMNVLSLIWHGMNYPDSLPARESFLYVFMLLVMSFEALGHIRELKKYQLIIASVFAAAVYILCLVFDNKDTNTAIETWILSGIFLGCYLIVLFSYYSRRYFNDFVGLLLCITVVLEAGINMYVTCPRDLKRAGYYKNYQPYLNLSETAKKDNRLNQGEFTRIEELDKNIRNDSMLEGFSSSSYFSSTMNSKIKDFYSAYGMEGSKVFYMSNGMTPFTAALLGTDYYISTSEIESVSMDSVMEYVASDSGDYLYRNTYALPFGYTVPSGYEESTRGYRDPIDHQNILSEELGGKEIFDRIGEESVADHAGETEITVPYSGHVYAYPSAKKLDSITLSANDIAKEQKFSDVKYNYILDLGYHEAGTVLKLTADADNSGQFINPSCYILNEDALKELTDSLSESTLTVTDFTSDNVEGVVNMKKAGRLVLTVPDEAGWTLKVDGAETETEDFESLFICVPLDAGVHQISLTFRPLGLKEGMVISLSCLCVFVLISSVVRRSSERRRKKEQEQ